MGKISRFILKVFCTRRLVYPSDKPSVGLLIQDTFDLCVVIESHLYQYSNCIPKPMGAGTTAKIILLTSGSRPSF
jgi:hypothetical protein